MAWAVIVIWAIVTMAALITHDETLVATTSPVALVVLGFYFGGYRRNGGSGDH